MAAATVLVAGALTGCKNFDPDRVCDASGCILLGSFSANIKSQLEPQVVGYVSTVGALAHINEYGQARTAADAPATSMKIDSPMNVASVSKFLTTIGVLQSLKAHNLTIDDKILPYLPSDWTKGPNVGTITFRELLTHKAGFRADGNGSKTKYANVKDQIQMGVVLADKQTAVYNNLNFAIFRELLPFMEGFSDPGSATRATATAKFYIDYMRSHVFQPAGVTAADCKPTGGNKQALMYPAPPTGSTKGDDAGDWVDACGGGGWVLTAADLYKVMIALVGTSNLLDSAQKDLMDSNCLGWDCSVQTQTNYVGKNGGLTYGGGRSLATFVGVFKGSVVVVVMVNSPPPMNITNVVANAFTSAAVTPP